MILTFCTAHRNKWIVHKRAKLATLKYLYKYISFAEYSSFPAGLPSHFSSYERSQNGLGWKEPQSSSCSSPCRGQGCHSLDQAAQGPIQTGFEGGYFYWTGVRSVAMESHCLRKARSRRIPAGELSSSGTFCSLQHLPNGRHRAELPWIPSVGSWGWLECVWFWASAEENLPLSTDCAAFGKKLLFDSTDPHLQSAVGTRLSPLKLPLRFIYSLSDLISCEHLTVGWVHERTTTSVNKMWCCGVSLVCDAGAKEGISTTPQLVVSVKVHSSGCFWANISSRNRGVCIWPLKLRAKLQRTMCL